MKNKFIAIEDIELPDQPKSDAGALIPMTDTEAAEQYAALGIRPPTDEEMIQQFKDMGFETLEFMFKEFSRGKPEIINEPKKYQLVRVYLKLKAENTILN